MASACVSGKPSQQWRTDPTKTYLFMGAESVDDPAARCLAVSGPTQPFLAVPAAFPAKDSAFASRGPTSFVWLSQCLCLAFPLLSRLRHRRSPLPSRLKTAPLPHGAAVSRHLLFDRARCAALRVQPVLAARGAQEDSGVNASHCLSLNCHRIALPFFVLSPHFTAFRRTFSCLSLNNAAFPLQVRQPVGAERDRDHLASQVRKHCLCLDLSTAFP